MKLPLQPLAAPRRVGLIPALALTIPLAFAGEARALLGETIESDHHTFRVVAVAEDLDHAWGIAFLPGGDILVTERPGRLRLIEDGQLREAPVSGTPDVFARGQGGLLDVAIHPEFAENHLVYLSYSKPGEDEATTAVARGRYEDGALVGLEDIFVAEAWSSASHHFAGRIAFDAEGDFYLSVGDRGRMERAQDLSDHAGTILHLKDDGSVPDDNPFLGQEGTLPEIFSYGNRNGQGLALHPETGALWENEHGARGGDEVNLIEAGKNYGWPVITHGVDYSGEPIGVGSEKEGMEQPLKQWTPSIAPSGMAFYSGEAFPDWQGDIFIGALVDQDLVRLRFEGTEEVEEERLLDGYARIRQVATGPDGYIYLLLDESSAPLIRLEPTD